MEGQDQEQNIFQGGRKYYRNHLKTKIQQQIKKISPQNQRWSGNTFYLNLKKKIHQKIKTQPLQFNNFIQPQQINSKPKSKITISTLQIALDPLCKKLQQQRYQISRKIYHKVQSNTNVIKTQPPLKLTRNLSAKISSQKNIIHNDSSNSKHKPSFTCRKNSKNQQKINQFKNQSISKNKTIQQNKLTYQHSSILDLLRLRKTKSEILKKDNEKEIVKIKNFDTEPLMFYFKAKNNVKISNRQHSIKKIRSSKNNKLTGLII